jgi:hypothetical protein
MFQRIAEAVVVAALLVPTSVAFADVKSEEKTQMKFEGGLGRMMSLFGGKTMRDGIVSTEAVKGDRKLTLHGDTGQLVDLKEEKVYDLDIKNRTYTVMTFAEIRKRFEEARQKAAAEQAKAQQEAEKEKAKQGDEKQPQFDVDFDLKETGQKRNIAGLDTREVLMTVIVREKGKKLEESGGMVLTSSSWLASDAGPLKESAAFDIRYAQQLHGPMMMDAQQMQAALQMYPMLKDAMDRMQKENVNMNGTPVLTVLRAEAAAPPEQANNSNANSNQKPQVQEENPASVGGLGGMLARRMMKRKQEKEKEEAATAAAAPSAPGRATIFTMTNEVLKVTPAVTDADVAIPAGFKQKS